MPNWAHNSVIVNFEPEKWVDEEDILRAYAFREEHGTDVTDNIHPLLVDKRLRHVPKAALAKFQNILFKMRYDQIKDAEPSTKAQHAFVGIDGTINGKNSLFVVEDSKELHWVTAQFKKASVSVFDKFNQKDVLKLLEEWSRDFLGIWDKRIFNDWRDYSVDIIGTKWVFDLNNVERTDDELTFTCETAWCSPDTFLQTLATDYELEVGLAVDLEGGDWNHAPDCLAEMDANDGECKYDWDGDTCSPEVIEAVFYPEEEQCTKVI